MYKYVNYRGGKREEKTLLSTTIILRQKSAALKWNKSIRYFIYLEECGETRTTQNSERNIDHNAVVPIVLRWNCRNINDARILG